MSKLVLLGGWRICFRCGHREDEAHTMAQCVAWRVEVRRRLARALAEALAQLSRVVAGQ